ncbi:hypothetical protein [Dyella sp.]|uniref:hypothetical protein n=1 Tax=Dyella sp. TaxID=1869338 RepID=UPI003F80BDA3
MSPQPQYQPDTVDARQLLRVGAIFALAFGLILALMYLLWRPQSPRKPQADAVPPAPRLQADPRRDLLATQMEQQRRLQQYGWNDPQHRSAHIPLQQAMARLAAQGERQSAAADQNQHRGAGR